MNYKDWNIIGVVTLCSLFALSAVAVYSYAVADKNAFSTVTVANIGGDLLCMLACVIIFASTLRDHHIDRGNILLLSLLTFESLLLFWDLMYWMVEGDPDRILLNQLSNYFIYILMLTITATFWAYIRELLPEQRKVMNSLSIWIIELCVISAILIATNPWTQIYFTVDTVTGIYHRSDTFYISMLAPVAIAMIGMVCILRYVDNLKRKLVLLGYAVIPLAAAATQYLFYGISLQYTSMMMAIVLMYANIYNDRSAELMRNEMEMTEQRAAAMVSQIQPHFLYNALTSIMNIQGNSWEVRDAIADFGRYLRFNMDSVTQRAPIPFNKELEHVETYIELRKLKYGGRLDVQLNIRNSSFFIPSQTMKVILHHIISDNLDVHPDRIVKIRIDSYLENDLNIIEIQNLNPPKEDREFVSDEANGEIYSLRERLSTMVSGDICNIVRSDAITARITIPRTGASQ